VLIILENQQLSVEKYSITRNFSENLSENFKAVTQESQFTEELKYARNNDINSDPTYR